MAANDFPAKKILPGRLRRGGQAHSCSADYTKMSRSPAGFLQGKKSPIYPCAVGRPAGINPLDVKLPACDYPAAVGLANSICLEERFCESAIVAWKSGFKKLVEDRGL